MSSGTSYVSIAFTNSDLSAERYAVVLERPVIDLAILTRDESPLSPQFESAVGGQQHVDLRIHRIIGTPQPGEPHRIATITRARNEALARGSSPWFMFLDDDVIPASDCVARLHHALQCRPNYGAFAADYLGEQRLRRETQHVGMGATMFRRPALTQIGFRWEANKCECLCCCEDLRQLGLRIGYLPGARAFHMDQKPRECEIPSSRHTEPSVDESASPQQTPANQTDSQLASQAKVMVAFDRRDVRRFRDVFLRSLRAFSNLQEVIVIGYGLYPTEVSLLNRLPGVRVVRKPVDGRMAPVRRLEDFEEVLSDLPEETPAAYWDASDVIFQGSLNPLWNLTQKYSGKLLAVREPLGYPYNSAIPGWTRTIRHPTMRRRAFELFSTNPFLNSGFGAGTASALAKYFQEATRLRNSPELQGTTDWGDQTAMNLYCHSDSSRWQEVPESWNYCVHDRRKGDVKVTPDGRVTCRSKTPIYVVHGNARSLAKMAIVR